MADAAALALHSVTKRFGGLVAVRQVSFAIQERGVTAVIGPNGAGKTTLFHVISGELPATSGDIRLFGQDVTRAPAHVRSGMGLARTFQITNIFPELTVEENAFLAALGHDRRKYRPFLPWKRQTDLRERAEEVLQRSGLSDKASWPAKELSHGDQRLLEISLALLSRPRVLLLDEPMAGLAQGERREVADIIRDLAADLIIVLVEHDMHVVMNLADRILCLHEGRVIADGPPAEIRQNPQVQEAYLGLRQDA